MFVAWGSKPFRGSPRAGVMQSACRRPRANSYRISDYNGPQQHSYTTKERKYWNAQCTAAAAVTAVPKPNAAHHPRRGSAAFAARQPSLAAVARPTPGNAPWRACRSSVQQQNQQNQHHQQQQQHQHSYHHCQPRHSHVAPAWEHERPQHRHHRRQENEADEPTLMLHTAPQDRTSAQPSSSHEMRRTLPATDAEQAKCLGSAPTARCAARSPVARHRETTPSTAW